MAQSPNTNAPKTSVAASSFAPLAQTVFAVMWVATVMGNTGSFVRDVASSWLVTELSASPAAVAAIQMASTLPIFLLAIPAGVLSDILDRRKFLIFIQIWLACTSATLVLLSTTGLLTVSALIILTFIGGIGAALMGPTWQAIVPELVERKDLKSAVALNSLGINIARSIGPALGGVLLASLGAGYAYGADVISYFFIISALLWWKRPEKKNEGLNEHFGEAFRAGLRYAKSSRELHIVLFRALIFFLFASSIWALLPLVAREILHGEASFYGLLMAAIGVGAIGGAFLLPLLREKFNPDQLMLLAGIVAAGVIATLSFGPHKAVAVILLAFFGIAWLIALTTLNSTAQMILPNWVRGRGLAIYLTVFNGAMAAGSLGWGITAQYIGVPYAILTAATCLVLVSIIMMRFKLPSAESDLEPANHWADPMVADEVENDRGPVMVVINYKIAEKDKANFRKAINALADTRRKSGAFSWGIMEDAAKPEDVIEWFIVESWAEHLRQHKRVSHEDADVQNSVAKFHQGKEPPIVHHYLAIDEEK